MFSRSDNLLSLLQPFGLTEEESAVYLCLIENGTKSALEISRGLKMGRTKVYRLVNQLIQKGLVTQAFEELGFKFTAGSYQQLELLLKQREHEVETLKNTLPSVFQQLSTLSMASRENSKVLYYKGVEGLEQVTWNSSKAKDKLRIFEIVDMSAFLDYGFCEKVRQEFVKNNVKVFELSNEKHMAPWTKVSTFVTDLWQCRYIDPKELEMRFELVIYNNVYAMYGYKEKDIFCVEVYNDDLAFMQKQLFDHMWAHARKTKVLSASGETILA
ncbi:MAG: Transcriptional regulator, TrmB [Microgenomates group bacterium GW2011_GWA2_44_7]|nr:MAG: Transcriptional regulator, TrmB [Microgenomates group bacterium GW2011_GWA2_44_7]KKT77774.1 MAG: Transcriptional regulator, TrmB [Microgenomates group bacterium GW2011_GWB1_44_8]